jgi:hypothetical protein
MPDSADLIMMPAADDLIMSDAVGLTVVAAVAAGVEKVLQHLHEPQHGPPKPALAEVPMPAAAVLMQLFHSQVAARILMDWWQLSYSKIMMVHLQ